MRQIAGLLTLVLTFAQLPAASAGETVSFVNDVVPVLTRLGCNGGGCHGKAEGQNGFKLSLFGFEPDEDFVFLRDSAGRRLNFFSPKDSLLLLKATGSVPHAGGRLTGPGGYYQILHDWIAQGARKSIPGEAKLKRIEITPAENVVKRGGSVRLQAIAYFDDGSKRDVTRLTVFKAEPAESISVGDEALVTVGQHPVNGSVMARYQGEVAVARVLVPLGEKVTALPPVRTFVDEHVFKQLKIMGLPSSPETDDATFLRRITIDLAGRLPTVEELKSFTADTSDKRYENLVDRLLASDDYAYLFASKWAAVLRNRGNPGDDRAGTLAFHQYIVKSLKENMPFDEFTRSILTATGEEVASAPIVWYRELKDANSLAEDAAQLFLGQRVQCARCHHHPSERWSQSDYWGLAAFFSQTHVEMPVPKKPGMKDAPAGVQRPTVTVKEGGAMMPHPRTGGMVRAAGLGEPPASIPDKTDPRVVLAGWITNPRNPFYAKSLVNRYWKHFMGRGLVEPEDDMRATNPATHPELLDQLASHFVANKYDLKSVIRAICLSSTYRLSCEPNVHNATDRQHYARFLVRRMPAEVMYDAIDQVTLSKPNFGSPRAVMIPDNRFESYFLRAFGRPDGASACECERVNGHNLAQILHMFNSDELLTKIGGPIVPDPVPEPSPSNKNKKPANNPIPKANPGARLDKIVADKRPHAEKVADLYAIAFSRRPTEPELNELVAYIDRRQNDKAAYADILWAILNSTEFAFNH